MPDKIASGTKAKITANVYGSYLSLLIDAFISLDEKNDQDFYSIDSKAFILSEGAKELKKLNEKDY